MPSYLFHCRNCQKPFTKQLSLQEYEESNVVCPLCGSDEVDQQLSPFLRRHFKEERLIFTSTLAPYTVNSRGLPPEAE